MILVKCQICGKEFLTKPSVIKKGSAKYCSLSCCAKSKNRQIKTKCIICSKELFSKPSCIRHTCSDQCHRKDLSNRWIARHPRAEMKCKQCGKVIMLEPSKIRKGHKFCCHKCSSIWASENRKGVNNFNWTQIKKECLICRKIYTVRRCRAINGTGNYCSRRCMGLDRRGMKAPSWDGGHYNELLSIRGSQRNNYWKQSVFLRDKFICQKCGQVGGHLNAHHVKSFSNIIDDIRNNLPLLPLKEAAEIYGPLWDITNGTTLCVKCHREVHWGKK